MTIGVVGRKCGMTRVFTEDGVSIPVTVIEIEPNRVTQFKNEESDGYRAVQVTVGERRASRVTKAQAGHFAKANVAAGRGVWEFRLEGEEFRVGDQINAEIFRASWWMSPVSPRVKALPVPSSAGISVVRTIPTVTPYPTASRALLVSARLGRVFKGKKMSGHMGAERVTVQSLEIVRVDAERNLLLVKGAVPGATGGDVFVRPAVKARG